MPPYDRFSPMLAVKVRVAEARGFVEHVLVEQALVATGCGDGADVVEAFALDDVGKLYGVAGAAHVGGVEAPRVGGHVVECREMEKVADAPTQLIE